MDDVLRGLLGLLFALKAIETSDLEERLEKLDDGAKVSIQHPEAHLESRRVILFIIRDPRLHSKAEEAESGY